MKTQELKSKINAWAKKTIHLVYNENRDSFSKIGILPIVPPEFEWPVWNGKSLSFLMQLKFSEINPKGELPDFPTSGLMYVFYDQKQSTWGSDLQDKGSWRILFYPETDNLKTIYRYPKDVKVRYGEEFLSPKIIKTIPAIDSDEIDTLNLDDKQWDWYCEYVDEPFDDLPAHQLGGYQSPIQGNDMDLECQLTSNGFYAEDSESPRAKELAKNSSD
ncbi:hypothetical protein FACS1894182_11680 [Bacteroidia bacterium]|nr:hypothetical protein FACS1894182_11680 [Bacteroidia bacterium]